MEDGRRAEQPKVIREKREAFESLDLQGLFDKLSALRTEQEALKISLVDGIQLAQVESMIVQIERRITKLMEEQG